MSSHGSVAEQAHKEMLAEFNRNCKSELSEEARQELTSYFEKTIKVLLEENRIEWEGKAKKFSLSAAAGLGREIDKATGGGRVSRKHVIDSLTIIIPQWERSCPLPPVGETKVLLLRDCATLRAVAKLPPAAG